LLFYFVKGGSYEAIFIKICSLAHGVGEHPVNSIRADYREILLIEHTYF